MQPPGVDTVMVPVWPGTQRHAVMAELPESRLALPLGQAVQPAEPDNDLYWPAGQAMQVSVVALVRVPLSGHFPRRKGFSFADVSGCISAQSWGLLCVDAAGAVDCASVEVG